METYSKKLLAEVDTALEKLHAEFDKPLEYSALAVEILIPVLRQLKSFVSTYTFKDAEEEIHFFKYVKPQFVYRLIYYNEVYIIESNRPYGGNKFDRDYIKQQIALLKRYIDSNFELYRYFRNGNNVYDSNYFLRGKPNLAFSIDSFYFDSDHDFSTSHDFKIAKFMASDLLFLYLHQQLSDAKSESPIAVKDLSLKWTAPKVYFIELLYALHTAGVFNNGKTELTTLFELFSPIFDIEPGQFNRTFIEIRSRKKTERTKFLSILITDLNKRMDEADG